MKIHRFYMPESFIGTLRNTGLVEIRTGESDMYFDPEEFVHQVTHVLRFKTGDVFHVFNSEVGEYLVSVVGFNKKSMEIKLEREMSANVKGKGLKIVLAMSLIKKDKFELVAEKATELGVSAIIPLITERVVQKNVPNDRLLRIVKEAAEQSGRVRIPEIRDTEDLKDMLQEIKNYDLCLFGNMEGELSFKDTVAKFEKDKVQSIILFIGPEGGWTEGEVGMLKDAGVQSLSIHENTLRAETAAIGVLGFLGGIMR